MFLWNWKLFGLYTLLQVHGYIHLPVVSKNQDFKPENLGKNCYQMQGYY